MRVPIGLALATIALTISATANAAPIIAGSSLVAPTPGVPAGQGTLVASQSYSGTAFTFAATFNQAVYLNTAGTLDFYYQVIRTGPGSLKDKKTGTFKNDEIHSFAIGDFTGYLVNGFASAADPDGAGLFVAANNPKLANGTPSPSTTTFGRSLSDGVVSVSFGANGLTGTENSATYIFRTNATAFDSFGSFGIIDGSTLADLTFEPVAVPEPMTWATMMLGFGVIGGAMRYRRRKTGVAFA